MMRAVRHRLVAIAVATRPGPDQRSPASQRARTSGDRVQSSIRTVMTTLHLLCGFIGAGKTTFAKSLERDHSAVLFSHDEWVVKLYGRNPPGEHFRTYYHRVEDLIWQLASRFLALGQDVVLDHGYWRGPTAISPGQSSGNRGSGEALFSALLGASHAPASTHPHRDVARFPLHQRTCF